MLRIIVLTIGVFIALLATPLSASAAQAGECDAAQGIVWREMGTKSFSILYPDVYEPIGRMLSTQTQGDALDLEYARLEALFETSLPLPVSIRIYPDIQAYSCLNSQGGEILPSSIHSHSGAREIALIGNNILANPSAWVQNRFNFIRYELGILFARQIASDRVPPGLLAAIGHYTQDPFETIGRLQLNWADWPAPTQDWHSLWEQASPQQDLGQQLQATSAVAFLVDSYGWAPFLKFLHSLPASRGFSPALSQSFGADFSQLEAEWISYYPRYFQGRWQSHLIYNYDLSVYLDLIRAEKYSEADRKLQKAIVFLEKMHSPQRLAEARVLQAMARSGQEAVSLFARSQRAFQVGDFPGSLALLRQAEQRFAQAGTRFIHLDEHSGYRQQVLQVVALRGELDRLKERVDGQGNTFLLAAQLVPLGRSLSALGDAQGYAEVRAIAQVIEARQQTQFDALAAAVLVVIAMLLVVLIRLLRLKPPPEAQL